MKLTLLAFSYLSLAWFPSAVAQQSTPVRDTLSLAADVRVDIPQEPVLRFLFSDGIPRWYRVAELPRPVEGLRPVVFCFHGGGGSASGAIERYGIVEEARGRGWFAVFPEGTGTLGGPPGFALQTWNAGNCCGFAMQFGIDDVQFFADMLEALQRNYPIDPERVFVTGMSNGAMMSYRIGVERPDLVTAIGPVAGARETGPPSVPLPILAIHGALDALVPPEGGVGAGGTGVDFTSQEESLAPFLKVNGALPAVPFAVGKAVFSIYPHPVGGADTWYMFALDGGHTWPGSAGSPIDPSDPVHTDVPATPLLFDFFELQFPRPPAHGRAGEVLR